MSKSNVGMTLMCLMLATMAAVGAGVAEAQTIVYPLQQQSPVTAGLTSGGAANCTRGYRFQVNAANKAVYQLGCWYPDGATQSKTLVLWEITSTPPAVTSGTILAQVTTTPGPGWNWVTLTTPVPLTMGGQYIIIGHTVTSSYYFGNPTVGAWYPTGDIQYLDMRYGNSNPPTTFPTSVLTNIHYGVVDIGYGDNQVQGSAMTINSAGVSSGGLSVGANTVTATLRNMGTAAFDNIPIPLQYSTDGGTSWTATQPFVYPTFPGLTNQTATFTLPWAVAAFSNQQLRVRIPPPAMGPYNQEVTVNYQPDLDITSVATNPAVPVLTTPMPVSFTVRNSGNFNHNSQTFSARYTLDNVTFVTQSFTPTTLASNTNTETFTFTTPLIIPVSGTYNLTVSIFPQVTADPDSSDSLSLVMPNVGIPFVTYAPTAGVTTTTLCPPIYRSASLTTPGYTSVYQQIYPAAQLGALPNGAVINNIAFNKTNDHMSSPGKQHILRVWLQNTTDTAVTAASTYGAFATGSTLVYETTTFVLPQATGWLDFGPFNQATPFVYTGGNIRVSVEFYALHNTLPVTQPGPSAATGLAWQYEAVTVGSLGQQFTSLPILPTATVSLNGLNSGARLAHARFFYDPPVPTDIDVANIQFGTTTLTAEPSVGSNVVNAVIRNMGTAGYAGTYDLGYSTDGGTNWINQTFTAAGLTSIGATQTVAFTVPWTISALGTTSLRVRISPQVTGDPDPIDVLVRPYVVDADVDAVLIQGSTLNINQPITVRARIKNNGSFNLNGAGMVLRYSIDNGTTWVPQPFTASTLAANGNTELFTFTTPTSFTVAGNHTVLVQLTPALTGDPDSLDQNSLAVLDVGNPVVNVGLAQFPGGALVSNTIPLTYASSSYMSGWYPEQLRNTAGIITEFGLQWSTVSTKTFTNLKITLGETNLPVSAGFTLSTPFLPYFNVGTPVVVFDGPSSITTTAVDQYVRWTLTTPYNYTGQNILLYLLEFTSPATGGPSLRVYSGGSVNVPRFYNSVLSPTGTAQTLNYSNGASFYFVQPANVDLDVDSVKFASTSSATTFRTGPEIGANYVTAKIKSFGMLPFSGIFDAGYSVDNGQTWVNQTFTAAGLTGIGSSMDIGFTVPWTVSGPLSAQALRIRIFPQATGDPDLQDVMTFNYAIDADIASVAYGGYIIQTGLPIIVKPRVRNAGGMSLNGVSLPMRYSVDNGTTWVPQIFTPTALGSLGDIQEFAFTQTTSYSAAGNYTILVEINPGLAGDPDTLDSGTLTLTGVGNPVVEVGAAQFPGASTGGNAIPFGSYASIGYMTYWHPEQLRNVSGEILEFGFQYQSVSTKSIGNYKITLGETSYSSFVNSTNFLSYFDIGTPLVVYDAPYTLTTTVAGGYVRVQLTTPFIYSGQNKLLVYVELTGNGTAGPNLQIYSGGTLNAPRFYNTAATGPLGTGQTTNYGAGASFLFGVPADPGISVTRGGVAKDHMATDNYGITATANNTNTYAYTITNRGGSQNLLISGVNVTNLVNCTASVAGTAPTSVTFGGGTANLGINVNPGPGAFSFKITINNNCQVTALQAYEINVTGTGFVNTPPVVQFIGNANIQASGTHPNYLVETVVGTPMSGLIVRAVDPDTHQTVSITVNEAAGGTQSALAAGITTSFPVSSPIAAPPQQVAFAGTANTAGTVNFTATCSDNAVFQGSDAINFTLKIGARLDVTTATTVSQFVRVSGQKDFYRGQTSMAVDLKVSNNNSFSLTLNSLNLEVRPTAGGAPLTGFTFTFPTLPALVIPANTSNFVVPCTMDIAANASGTNNMACQFVVTTGVAIDPNPSNNPVVVLVTAPVDNIVLFDGPVPQPMQITLNAFNPVVETVPFLQNLTVTGGLGSYTWSIPATSTHQLPTGLILDPQGSQFLPAKISGTPALGTSILGPYSLTLRVTDGAYVDTKTLVMTVNQLTPLNFPPRTLANGQEFVAYSMTAPFTASGGSLIYTFSVDASSTDQLPAGLSLNSQTGVISGTPADGTQGSYSITFGVDDGQSQLTQTATLTINPHPLQWRGTTLPTAVQTVSYSEALDAIGGTGPRIYSIVSGTLPNGLSLNASNGVILGIPSLTPNSVGTYNMVFKVTDGLNASVNQAITITVVPAPPLVVTTSVLEYGMVGATYASAIAVTGGSQSYVISVASSSAAQLPAGLTLAPNGDITGTPEVGSDGRYAIDISVNDGFQTITETVILPVLNDGARGVAITEVSAGAGYIELANSEQTPVDVSGWSVTVWVDSNSPISLPFDSIPGASLALPAEVVTITLGGTAGGFWPSYNTGGTWTGTSTSNISVLLSDIHGNTIDFVSFGTANRSALVDSANAAIDLPAPLDTMANANNGAANYSYNGTTWVGSANGTPGVYNTGLAAFPLMIIKDALRTANSGQPFSDFTLAIGGRAPYAFTLTAPAAPWLSLSTNGVFSGTAPLVATATTVNVDVTVTDALTAAVTETFEIRIASASTTPSATFTVGNAEGQSFEGTVIDVPVTMTRASGVTDVQGLSFVIELAAPTALELDVVRVLPGPAVIAAGRSVVARDLGNNRIFIGDYGADNLPAANFADGVVAIVRFMVPVDNNVMAPEATYGVSIADTEIGRAATGVHTATGVNGSMVLSNYKPQDVNRDTAIDVVDVQQTVNIILSLFTPTYAGQGDANSDNAVDVVDVQTIVNCILLGGC